jgi:cysteine desulfurase
LSRAYLDHASTSPARPEVVDAMLPWLSGDHAADPGRVHTEGRMARVAIEDAREKVAALFGARSRSVVFTSGATEAINAAVFGVGGPILCAAVEHSAVRDASARHDVRTVPVDRHGRIDVEALAGALEGARLVHCQWGNHEVGTLQPVAEVVAACRDRGVLVHVDAAAAVGHVPITFDELGVDLMSVSAHKFGGPKGVGALLVRRGLRIDPLLVGGDQERARRAGMENVPAIVGFGAAADVVDVEKEALIARQQTERALAGALAVEGVTAYGDVDERLPHLVCVGVQGVEAEAVLLGLDQAGVAAHSGSACSSEALEPSPVLEAMGVDAERSLRVSVGWSTTDADIDTFVTAFPNVVARLRALR